MIWPQQEAENIVNTIAVELSPVVDGREAISQLRAADYQWRQMEWIGWWFEYFAGERLRGSLSAEPGPSFGNTQFDLQCAHVWDLKAHPSLTATGGLNRTAILNDAEAVDLCIENFGGIGFVIVHGRATFDRDGAFKRWHDELKGGVSTYEQARVARGAPSRVRKSAFEVTTLEALFFANSDIVSDGLRQGWLGYFQEGMRNSNGSPRRRKYRLDVGSYPRSICVASRSLAKPSR